MALTRNTVSPERLAANRANAAKSTGPRTPEGRARAAQNARKHGFAASTFAVIRLEEQDEVARLKDDLLAVYQPVNAQELFAVERIALAQQAMLRAARLETGLFTACLNLVLDSNDVPFVALSQDLVGDLEITRQQNRNYLMGEGFHRMVTKSNSWSLFLRYQAQAERHYRRAVEELERLRALRPKLPNEPNMSRQPQQPKAAPPRQTNPIAPQIRAAGPSPAASPEPTQAGGERPTPDSVPLIHS